MKWLSIHYLGNLLTQGLALASAFTSNGNHTSLNFKASVGNNILRAPFPLTPPNFTRLDFTQSLVVTENSRRSFTKGIEEIPVDINNISNVSSDQSKQRVRRSTNNENKNNASTTSLEGQQDHQPTQVQDQDLKPTIPCDLQLPLNALKCDQYVLVVQFNEELRSWKYHEAFVLALLARHYHLSPDAFSPNELPSLERIIPFLYEYIEQLTQPIHWDHALASNPNEPNQIGYDSWMGTVSNANGRSLSEVRTALVARIQTNLNENNRGGIPGLADEVFDWITQDPTLLGEPSSSILYGSWEWVTLLQNTDAVQRGTHALIETGYDVTQFSTHERQVIGHSIFSEHLQDSGDSEEIENLQTEVETPLPGQPSVATPISTQPVVKRDEILSLLLTAQASGCIDLRTLDPNDEKTMNQFIAYALLVHRFPNDPQIIKKIMALNSLTLQTRSDVAKENFYTLTQRTPSPEEIERYMKEDNLNWYGDQKEPSSRSTPPSTNPTTSPSSADSAPIGSRIQKSDTPKLSQEDKQKLKTASLAANFDQRFDHVTKALSTQTAEVINEILIIPYCQKHHINMEDASITVTTVQREGKSGVERVVDKVLIVAGAGSQSSLTGMKPPEIPPGEISNSKGYFIFIKTPATEQTPAAEHHFFVRWDTLEETPVTQGVTLKAWCEAQGELVFGTGHKENITFTYAVNDLANGKQQNIARQIEASLLKKLKPLRQEAYEPSFKEQLFQDVLDVLVPYYPTYCAISNGEDLHKIVQTAGDDTRQFIPTLFAGAGASLRAANIISRVLITEAAAISERGLISFLERSTARLASHMPEFMGLAADVGKTAAKDTFWPFHALYSGKKLLTKGVNQLRQRLSKNHPQLVQKLSETSKIAEKNGGNVQALLYNTGPKRFVIPEVQAFLSQELLFELTAHSKVPGTLPEMLRPYQLKDLAQFAKIEKIQQEKGSHIVSVGLRYYAHVKINEKNFIYVEVRPYGPPKSATFWHVYDPEISHTQTLPAIVWNEISKEWRPVDATLIGGVKTPREYLKVLTGTFRPLDDNLKNLIEEWKLWVEAAKTPNEFIAREAAHMRMVNFLKLDVFTEKSFNLCGLGLTKLTPRLRDDFKKLIFPAHLLIEIEAEKLDNPLAVNPLPIKLHELEIRIDDSYLLARHRLSPNLPKLLEHFSELKVLVASDCGITDFSRQADELLISKSLEILDLSDNQLKEFSLPSKEIEWKKLKKLDLSGNSLADVPKDIFKLSKKVEVNIERNLISHKKLEALHTRLSRDDYQGPRIRFSIFEGGDHEVPPLNKAIADWFPATKQDKIKKKWEKIRLTQMSSETKSQECEALSKILTHLSFYREQLSETDAQEFKKDIQEWLKMLSKSDSLRDYTLTWAYKGAGSCVDHALLVVRNMQESRMLNDVNNKKYNNDLPKLAEQLRQEFRKEKLSEIAHKTFKKMNGGDEMEVHLFFQVELGQELELERAPKKMLYPDISSVTQDDLHQALRLVQQKENEEYQTWLAKSPIWLEQIKMIEPTLYQAVMRQREAEIERLKPEKIERRLQELNLGTSEAIRHRIEKNLAEEQLGKIYNELTETVLTKRKLESLLDKKWPEGSRSKRSISI